MKFSRQSIASGTFVLVISTLLSNSLGIIREVLVAKSFGTTAMYDAYIIALYIPSTIYAAFFYGLSNVYTPLYYSIKNKNEKTAQTFSNNFIGSWIIFSIFLCLLIALLAPLILNLFSNLSQSTSSHVIAMTQLLMIGISLNCSFVIIRSLLFAKNHFLHPSIATVLYNFIVIGFIFVGSEYFSVYAMVYGSIIGMIFQLSYILILFKRYKIKITFFETGWLDSNIKRSFILAIPIMGIEALWGLFYLIDGTFASNCGEGNVASLSYAATLFRFPGYLIGMSLSSAILPSFSQAFQSNRIEDLRLQFSKAFRYVLLLSVFFSGIFFFESNNIVSMIFQRGAFDIISVDRTSTILKILSFGFFFVIMYPILTKVFNAKGNNVILLVSFVVGIVIKIVVYVLFFSKYGFTGVVLNMLLGYAVIFVVPFFIINRTEQLIGKSEYLMIVKSILFLFSNIIYQIYISTFCGILIFAIMFFMIFWKEVKNILNEIIYKYKINIDG